MTLRIAIASESAIKIDACQRVFPDAEIIPVKVSSGVDEQPVGDAAVEGARNRALEAREVYPSADYWIGIENGIFRGRDAWYDDPIVVIYDKHDNHRHSEIGDSIEFQTWAVDIARERGFATTTVASVLHEQGLIKNPKDPHACLAGRPRVEFLVETLTRAAKARGLVD